MIGPPGSGDSRHPQHERERILLPCNELETVKHILTECNSIRNQTIWRLAEETLAWPHAQDLWPNIDLGTIIVGIGCLTLPRSKKTRRCKRPCKLTSLTTEQRGSIKRLL